MKKSLLLATSLVLPAAMTFGVYSAAKEPPRPAANAPRATGKKDGQPGNADLAALRQSAQAFRDAFNHGNAKAIAALWTKDAEYIDESGEHFQGRDAIAKEYANFFAENPAAKITILVDSLRLISDDAAIESGRAAVSPPGPGAPATSKYTAVHAKVDGKWLMAFARDTRVETPSAYNHLKDFEWLAGTWSAVEQGTYDEGNLVEMNCAWGPNKSTFEIHYTINEAGGLEPLSGKQIVGWDPETRRIQSWSFSSDGGRSTGVWSQQDGGWTVVTQGVLPNGTRTSAINSFARMEDDAIIWQSSQRVSGGAPLQDAEEIILRRVGGAP